MAKTEDGRFDEVDLPPFAVLEYLNVGGVRLLRVVAQTDDEGQALDVTSAMAAAGLKVWLIKPVSADGSATMERYATPAMAVWANEAGHDLTARGGCDQAQLGGL